MTVNFNQYRAQFIALLTKFQDIRFVGQVAFIMVVLLISWSGVKSIQTNYGLQKQITGLSQQNELQKLANNNLELSNNYYKSNQYLELSARQNFGLAAAGEKQVVVPKAVALAKTSDITVPTKINAQVASQQRNNFEAWVNFFLHRSPTGQ